MKLAIRRRGGSFMKIWKPMMRTRYLLLPFVWLVTLPANAQEPSSTNRPQLLEIGQLRGGTNVPENVDGKLFGAAMAVVRARTIQKPVTYAKGPTTSTIVMVEVVKVIKQSENWNDFDEVKRWKLLNQLRQRRGDTERPLVLRLVFQHDGGQIAPPEGEMTVYLDQSEKEEIAIGAAIGAKPVSIAVKTLKPHGDSINTAISHVRAVVPNNPKEPSVKESE